jgi:hypothetical protein
VHKTNLGSPRLCHGGGELEEEKEENAMLVGQGNTELNVGRMMVFYRSLLD